MLVFFLRKAIEVVLHPLGYFYICKMCSASLRIRLYDPVSLPAGFHYIGFASGTTENEFSFCRSAFTIFGFIVQRKITDNYETV